MNHPFSRILKARAILVLGLALSQNLFAQTFNIDKSTLADKIKGGWAGQTIGVTFGGPYEFRFEGSFINDYQPLPWGEGYLRKNMLENPGLYDDLYMDLTFVDVFEKKGLDAPATDFGNAYAHAGYMLWHANQAGRYNILHGIQPPMSGHWQNNPHADCIDYQIESDFAGLMSPGMPNTASLISDKIGHIMNYGDGWYGGVYVGAMYALAFVNNDAKKVVMEALKTIPAESQFYQCISDVIKWHDQYPKDWKQTWFEVQKKWTDDIGCPEGIFSPYNIDARVNAAYVVIGLLYGLGDYTKTLEITTRCGQDADCNPSTAGGILGTILGYDKIPAYWKQGLAEAEDIDFKYTSMSLNDVYTIGLSHAIKNVERNGAKVNGNAIQIKLQTPAPVKFEKSFPGLTPTARIPVHTNENQSEIEFDFEGTGFVLRGSTAPWESTSDYVVKTELLVDGKVIEKPDLPMSYTTRRYELCWNYGLNPGKHKVKLKLLNPSKDYPIKYLEAFSYNSK